MIAALPASALLNIDGVTLWRLELGLAVGTPALAALGLMVSALTAGLRSSGALAGLLALPLAVPLLIFGAGMLTSGSGAPLRSEEHTSELQSLMRISYAVFCLKKKTHNKYHVQLI